MYYRAFNSVLLVVAVLAVVLPGTAVSSSIPERRGAHGVCRTCHGVDRPEPGSQLFAPDTDPSASCPRCHKDYRESHHPVGYKPADPSSHPFPLFDGEVKCLSCHEMHGGPKREGTQKFLRGGPYKDRREICFKCHPLEETKSIDPHKMLDEHGQVREVKGRPSCLWCHAKKPDPAVDGPKDMRFKAEIGFVCWWCHPPMHGVFFQQHFLARPSTQTRQAMKETAERLFVMLPLERGRVTCSTCHNPHQKGVIKREAAAKGADAVAKLRMPSVCFGCHRM